MEVLTLSKGYCHWIQRPVEYESNVYKWKKIDFRILSNISNGLRNYITKNMANLWRKNLIKIGPSVFYYLKEISFFSHIPTNTIN